MPPVSIASADGFNPTVRVASNLFLAAFLSIAVLGPGAYSVDAATGREERLMRPSAAAHRRAA